jgi:hypothetical protein
MSLTFTDLIISLIIFVLFSLTSRKWYVGLAGVATFLVYISSNHMIWLLPGPH